MPKRTLLLILALCALAIVLLFIAAKQPLYRQQDTTQQKKAQMSPYPINKAFSRLYLSPNPLYLGNKDNQGEINVLIDSGSGQKSNNVTAVQIEIAYDPNVLTNVDIVPGDFFPNPSQLIKNIDTNTGRITYALAITPAQTPVRGKGTVARLTFSKKTTPLRETTLTLLPKSLITEQGTETSVLKEAKGAKIFLTE
jgi:hypothetical protein